MNISARNIFKGKVAAIKAGALNSEIDLKTASGDMIVAMVTNDSVKTLGLAVGSDAAALVKASAVLVLTEGDGLKLSARNCLKGKIARITEGPVSAEISIALPGGHSVHATITHDASVEMGLKVGGEATAVFKASAVIVAVGG